MAAYVTLTKQQNIGYIEFLNPPHNALPPALLSKLCKLIKRAGEDDEIHVIVLKSGGDRTFCAGHEFYQEKIKEKEAEEKDKAMRKRQKEQTSIN